VTGDSYGGGQSMMLAALRDRVMLPDGSLAPWRSPAGTPLSIAAAAPVIPWSDLVYAIAPNGRTLTYTVTPPADDVTPVGVFKGSFAHGVVLEAETAIGPGQPVGEPFVPGRPMGYVAPPGADPEADITGWLARTDAGEPYDDAGARAIVDTLERHHSAYAIDAGRAPPPLLIASGFTDDLFPVDEAVRFVNRTRRLYPKAPVAELFGDFGHQRASNKAADRRRLLATIHAWFARYLRGGPAVPLGVTATTQTCPPAAPSRGPFTASTFTALARGEVRFATRAAQTAQAPGGDQGVAAAIDPVTGGGNACATTSTAPEPGVAAYHLPPAPPGGYTLLGAPTVIARLALNGAPGVTQLAARLWDVAPGGGYQTLVARGLYRPTGRGTEVWQLHANGWTFAPGHVAKLQLLGADPPYGRPSNGAFSVAVQRLELRLPVRERPDCRVILPALAPVVPAGQPLAPGVSAAAAPGCGAARRVAPARPRVRVRARCTVAGLLATATVTGARARWVDFYVGRRWVVRDRRAPFARTVAGRGRGRLTVRARAALSGRRAVTGALSTRACARRRAARFTG
jgi:hypothetical protein